MSVEDFALDFRCRRGPPLGGDRLVCGGERRGTPDGVDRLCL